MGSTVIQASDRQTCAGRHVFVVCTGESCKDAGADALLEGLNHECKGHAGDVRLGASKCLGHCAAAPAVMEDGHLLRWVSWKRLRAELMRIGIL
jgi:NADH:ubiquinone oxidoreductase subunit E